MAAELRRFVRLLLATVRVVVEAPRRWTGFGRSVALLIVACLIVAYDAKRPIQALFDDRHGPAFAAWLARTASAWFEGHVLAMIGVLLFIVGEAIGRRRVVDAAVVLGAAGIPCWLLIVLGQFVFAESRPIDGGAMHWFARDGHGVSGHASAGALLLAPAAVLTHGAPRWLRQVVLAAVIGWALVVGWSRVWLSMHFVWNVLFGLTLGWVTARSAVRAWRVDSGS